MSCGGIERQEEIWGPLNGCLSHLKDADPSVPPQKVAIGDPSLSRAPEPSGRNHFLLEPISCKWLGHR